jgi:hypothetical protein
MTAFCEAALAMSALDLCFGIFFLVGFVGCLAAIPLIHRACEGYIKALELSDRLEADRMRRLMDAVLATRAASC